MDPNLNYIEDKVEKIYAKEIIPAEKVKLTPLNDRDEFIFDSPNDEQHFKNEERRVVAQRRMEYSLRRYGEIRDVVETNIDRRK